MCHSDAFKAATTADVRTDEGFVRAADGSDIPVLTAGPSGGVPVIIGTDIFGRSLFYRQVAAELGRAGFRAVLPDLFHRVGDLDEVTYEAALARRVRLDERTAFEDLVAVVEWARSEPGQRVGAIGFCLGGTLVLDLAARDDALATVCFYGFPAGSPPLSDRNAPVPLEVSDRMAGPILGFWGEQDELAGIDNVTALDQSLAELGVDHEFVILPGLGHGFMSALAAGEDRHGYRESMHAWNRTLEFLERRLT